jgi:biotin operon repressor
MNYLELFEKTNKTVEDFNSMFPRSKLYYPRDCKVRIGRPVQGGFREIFVDGEVVLHEIIMPKVLPENPTKPKVGKNQTDRITYATYDDFEDIKMSAPVYKIWQMVKVQNSQWHTEARLAKAIGSSDKTVRASLRELKELGKIELETSSQGIKITLKGE